MVGCRDLPVLVRGAAVRARAFRPVRPVLAALLSPPSSCRWSRRSVGRRRSRRRATRSRHRRSTTPPSRRRTSVLGFDAGPARGDDRRVGPLPAGRRRGQPASSPARCSPPPTRAGRCATPSSARRARVAAAQAAGRPRCATRRRPPPQAAADRRVRAGDPLGRGQRARRRGERHRRRPSASSTSSPPAPTAPPTRSATTRSSRSCRPRTRTGARLDTRRNAYGFDMNRDWFARTQPETDGKLRGAAAVPAGAVHRRARDGQQGLLLPAERRPDLPRDHRRVGVLDQRPLRPGDAAGVRPAAASRTSTTPSTTSSTWATATRCRPPASSAPA